MKIINFPVLKISISYFLISLMLFQSVGCNYFKVNKVESDFEATINEIGEVHKYFLIHDQNDTYSLSDITIDSTFLHGTLESPQSIKYNSENRGYRYHKHERDILNEVHFYLNVNAERLDSSSTNIPLSDIKEIRIIEKDTGKTVASYIFTGLGILAAVYVIVVIIVLLTKSSCPYVYVEDNEGFVFEGETFGGAIGQNLQRDDYMPLPSIKAKTGTYRLRISNELKERQYTDIAELMVVNHTYKQKVLLDKSGQPQIIEKLHTYEEATGFDGIPLQSTLEKKDSDVFLFDNISGNKNGAILKFKKPANVTNGKLVLNAKNTLWFDYMFGEFLKKFGTSFDMWMEQQAELPSAERIEKINNHDFPLSVYIMKDNKWQLVDYLNTVGPLANRDFVVPIDLTDIAGDEVEIKLETGFMFWELDYVGIDFSNTVAPEMAVLEPFLALGTGTNDWTTELKKIDGQYMAQENVGDVTEIIFKIPTAFRQESQTVFLHTRGYYELIRDFEGLPQISSLNKFKVPDYFSEFSREGFMKTIKTDEDFFAGVQSN